MAGAGDDRFPGADGSGHIRAALADREHVVGVLKTAFVRGMIDKSEFDQRVSRTFASRTYAELAEVTRDLPADLPAAAPLPTPASAQAPEPGWLTMKRAVIISACLLISTLIANVVTWLYGSPAVLVTGLAFVMATVISGTILPEAWNQRRAQRQLPQGPASGAGGQAVRGSRTRRQRRSPGRGDLTLIVTA